MAKRINGQLWIDKNSPNRLKYFINGETYSVVVENDFAVGGDVKVGQVVAFSSKDDSLAVKPAVFPDDIDNILGVVVSSSTENGSISISKSGVITLTEDTLDTVLYNTFDFDCTEWESPTFGIGAPVYWYIGNTEAFEDIKDNRKIVNYRHIDSTAYKGCISLCTPSGYKWKTTSSYTFKLSDETVVPLKSMNVAYNNLPIIGNVLGYKVETINNEKKFTELKINLNINKFDSAISWSWPYLHDDNAGKFTPTEAEPSIIIRHGLFPYNLNDSNTKIEGKLALRPCNFCNITALDAGSTDTEYVVNAGVENWYGQEENEPASKDRRTEIFISTPDTYRYRITGTVNYKFDKQILGD